MEAQLLLDGEKSNWQQCVCARLCVICTRGPQPPLEPWPVRDQEAQQEVNGQGAGKLRLYFQPLPISCVTA